MSRHQKRGQPKNRGQFASDSRGKFAPTSHTDQYETDLLLDDAALLAGPGADIDHDPYLNAHDLFKQTAPLDPRDLELDDLSDSELMERAKDRYNLTRPVARWLADHPNVYIAAETANNPACPRDIRRHIANRPDIAVELEGEMWSLADVQKWARERSMNYDNDEDRGIAASDVYAESDVLDRLSRDMMKEIRDRVKENPSATPAQREQASKIPPSNVEQLRVWSHDEHDEDTDEKGDYYAYVSKREYAAKDPMTPRDCLERLEHDRDPYVRRALTKNPAISDEKKVQISLGLPPGHPRDWGELEW